MTFLNDIPLDPAKSNPFAASVRLESCTRWQAYGQLRHDLRKGKQPDYVDPDRAHLNRVLIALRGVAAIQKDCVALREARGAQRAMKSNAAVIKAGIISFGYEAAKYFKALTAEQQDAAYRELAQAVADYLQTSLEALVHHGDETQPHAHFALRAYSDDGQPVCKRMTKAAMSVFQDLTAEILQKYCPEIQRGHRKKDRLAAGASYPDTLNRSVRQLHEDLPAEIEAKQAEAAALQDRINQLQADLGDQTQRLDKYRQRVRDLETREDRSAKEEKRLMTYEKRVAKQSEELSVKHSELHRLKTQASARIEDLRLSIENSQAEQDRLAQQHEDLRAEKIRVDHVRQEAEDRMAVAETAMTATEQTLREIEEGTVEEVAGKITMKDPSPLHRAPKPIQNRLIRVLSKHLKVKRVFAERFKVLDGLLSRVTDWLEHRELDEQARRDGEELLRRNDDDGPGW